MTDSIQSACVMPSRSQITLSAPCSLGSSFARTSLRSSDIGWGLWIADGLRYWHPLRPPPLEVAAMANGLNVQRLGIIPVIVGLRRLWTIGASHLPAQPWKLSGLLCLGYSRNGALLGIEKVRTSIRQRAPPIWVERHYAASWESVWPRLGRCLYFDWSTWSAPPVITWSL